LPALKQTLSRLAHPRPKPPGRTALLGVAKGPQKPTKSQVFEVPSLKIGQALPAISVRCTIALLQRGESVRKAAFTERDLREVPAYGIGEAAGYLRLPVSTLRAWLLGQRYRVGDTPKFFRPVIEIADSKQRQMSFINLAEAFVLAGIRREHGVPLQHVRKAVDYVRKLFKSRRPLAEERFETDGIDLFVRRYGELVGVSQDGQTLMESMLRERLALVKHDPKGIPEKLVLFPAPKDKKHSADVVIDPRISFGRPVLDGLGVRTSILFERFMAGENVPDLARDYDAPPEAIQNAIRCELRAA
jgi:uncharacterized protein (DUF433 family)